MRERSRKYHALFLASALFLFSFSASAAQAREVPYSLEDRERIIRLEEGLKALNRRIDGVEKSVNQRIDGMEKGLNQRIDGMEKGLNHRIDGVEKGLNQRIDGVERRMERLETTMTWGFGLLFTSMIGLVGFVLWDRRSALAPAIRRTTDLESREEKLEAALKEFATKSPQMADSLKKVGLLR